METSPIIVKTVKLKDPIIFGDETVKELQFQKLRAKHMKNLKSNMDMGDILKLISKLTNTEQAKLDELSAEDFMECSKVVSDFLGTSLQTGNQV